MLTYALTYVQGTIIIENADESDRNCEQCDFIKWDSRVGQWRGLGVDYQAIKSFFLRLGCSIDDQLEILWAATKLTSAWQTFALRPYQKTALASWKMSQYRGIVSIPTGGGKTLVGVGALRSLLVPALIVVPTRVLLYEWIETIKCYFMGDVACYGDGCHDIAAITVATFAAAYRHAAKIGCHFKLLLVDEVHHFGANKQDELLEMLPAPMRLGLTATYPDQVSQGKISRTYPEPEQNQLQKSLNPERLNRDPNFVATGPFALTQVQRLQKLVGKKIFSVPIGDLVGEYLAPFIHIPIGVELSGVESTVYKQCYNRYHQFQKDFYRHYPQSTYKDFLTFAHKSLEGKEAIAAWVYLKKLVNFCGPKEGTLESLLQKHFQDKMLIFTGDTESAYQISCRFLLPIITGEIKKRERERVLSDFRSSRVRAIVSCRVLNEGVNIPDASIAVILGGTHGTREFIQRLGRILRLNIHSQGSGENPYKKRAIIYHIFVKRSIEENQRRLFQQVIFAKDQTSSSERALYDGMRQRKYGKKPAFSKTHDTVAPKLYPSL